MSLVDKIVAENNIESQNGAQEIRGAALAAFKTLGLPNTRHEEWKYTNIKTKLPEQLCLVSSKEISLPNFHSFENLVANKMVFVNGFYQSQLSSITAQDGVVITNLKDAFTNQKELTEKKYGQLVQLNEEHFGALNTAFAQDGVFIHVAKNVIVEKPLLVIHLYNNAEQFTQSRNLIIAENGAQLNIVEDFQNLSSSAFYNHVTEVYVHENANINITKLQTETINTTAVHTLEAELLRDAHFTCTTISFEGQLIRNNINTRLKGENSQADLNGLYYGKNSSLLDNHVLIDHIAPNCNSNQLYKGILDDESTGVFNGKIFVKQAAQKTNAFQSSKAILLSKEASINSKPQLEIFADDVKCSHGAAIGQLEGNEVFYLLARGIEEKEAKAMLTFAFANQLLDKISNEEIRTFIEEKLMSRLGLTL
jgi:Fe-S cluster assembly protein SufD